MTTIKACEKTSARKGGSHGEWLCGTRMRRVLPSSLTIEGKGHLQGFDGHSFFRSHAGVVYAAWGVRPGAHMQG